MSWKLMDRVLKDPALKPGPRLVLVVLASYHNSKTGQCYPGMRTIMRETGMSERTMLRAISILRSRNYIDVERGRSRLRTNLYFLHPERWPATAKEICQKSQIRPAISDESDLPTGQRSRETRSENQKQRKSKPCDMSQDNKKTRNLSKADRGRKERKIEKEGKKGGKEEKGPIACEEGRAKGEHPKSVGPNPQPRRGPLPPPPKGTSKLGLLWLEHLAAPDLSPCLTAKEGKMLRQVANRIGYENALVVIPHVVAHWKDFTDAVKRSGTGFTVPKEPNVPFLLKFVAVALTKATSDAKSEASRPAIAELDERIERTKAELAQTESEVSRTIQKSLPMSKKRKLTGATTARLIEWEGLVGPITEVYESLGHSEQVILERFCATEDATSPIVLRRVEDFKRALSAAFRTHMSTRLAEHPHHRTLKLQLQSLVKQRQDLRLVLADGA